MDLFRKLFTLFSLNPDIQRSVPGNNCNKKILDRTQMKSNSAITSSVGHTLFKHDCFTVISFNEIAKRCKCVVSIHVSNCTLLDIS